MKFPFIGWTILWKKWIRKEKKTFVGMNLNQFIPYDFLSFTLYVTELNSKKSFVFSHKSRPKNNQ